MLTILDISPLLLVCHCDSLATKVDNKVVLYCIFFILTIVIWKTQEMLYYKFVSRKSDFPRQTE